MTLRSLTIAEIDEVELRFNFHAPNGDQLQRYQALREKAHEYATLIMQCCPPSRERASAITELTVVNMLANSAIAINE